MAQGGGVPVAGDLDEYDLLRTCARECDVVPVTGMMPVMSALFNKCYLRDDNPGHFDRE